MRVCCKGRLGFEGNLKRSIAISRAWMIDIADSSYLSAPAINLGTSINKMPKTFNHSRELEPFLSYFKYVLAIIGRVIQYSHFGYNPNKVLFL